MEGGWQSVYLYHNLFHALMSSLPCAGAGAAAAAQTEMPTCLWANRKMWAEASANSKKTPCVFFQSWLLAIFYSPLLCAKACDGLCLSPAKGHWFFMWKNYQLHHLLQIIMNSILFLLPAISALVSELGREAWKHSLSFTLGKQCHALIGCCREVSGLV